MDDRRLLLLCHGGGWDRLVQIGSAAATAASMGWRVDLVFYFTALEKLLDGRLDAVELEPRDAAREGAIEDRALEIGTRSPSSLLAAARATGRVRVLACSASLALLGREEASIEGRVDAVVGWPTTMALMAEATQVLYV